MNEFSAALFVFPINPANRDQEPGVEQPYFGLRMRDVTMSATLGGYGSLTCKVACDPTEAARFQRRLFTHLVAWSYGERVYEGRLEQVGLIQGGVNLTFISYYNNLDDRLFDSKSFKPEASIDASAIVLSVIKDYATMLSTTTAFVRPPGLKLKGSDFDGGDSAKQIIETVLEAGDEPDPVPFYASIRENRAFWLVPQERALVSWTIPSRALTGPPAFTRDAQEMYSSVKVLFERKVKTSTGTKTVRDDATTPDAALVKAELGGNRREIAVSANKAVDTAAEALTFGQGVLGQYQSGVTRFSLTIRGLVENHVGGLYEPWWIFPGSLARLDLDPSDERSLDDGFRLFLVAERSWNVSTGEVTLQCEPMHGTQLDSTPLLASSGLVRVA